MGDSHQKCHLQLVLGSNHWNNLCDPSANNYSKTKSLQPYILHSNADMLMMTC